MLLGNECFLAARNTSILLNVSKFRKSKCVPNRLFFKWGSAKEKDSKRIKNAEEPKVNRITGIDDENFSKLLVKHFWDLNKSKEGFRKIKSECKRFYNEELSNVKLSDVGNFRLDDEGSKIHILHKFETEKDLEDFSINTDSSYLKGYTSASFKISENETGLFTGNLCMEVPKTGDVSYAGYANLQCARQLRAFFRVKKYDWTMYTHLVFKIRGDGRTYMVILHLPNEYKETSYSQYVYQLYTRGGPYWQIAKLPLSYFFFIKKGRTQDIQDDYIPLHKIVNMSISVGAYEGPFKLEIEYIGLEKKEMHKKTSPYEQYKV